MVRYVGHVISGLLLASCASGGRSTPPAGGPGAVIRGVGERAGVVLAQDAYGDGATRLVRGS